MDEYHTAHAEHYAAPCTAWNSGFWSRFACSWNNPDGIEVVFCKVKDQEHHIRRDLRDSADVIAIDFLLRHKRM